MSDDQPTKTDLLRSTKGELIEIINSQGGDNSGLIQELAKLREESKGIEEIQKQLDEQAELIDKYEEESGEFDEKLAEALAKYEKQLLKSHSKIKAIVNTRIEQYRGVDKSKIRYVMKIKKKDSMSNYILFDGKLLAPVYRPNKEKPDNVEIMFVKGYAVTNDIDIAGAFSKTHKTGTKVIKP